MVRLEDRRVSARSPSALIAFSLFESSTSVVPRLVALPWRSAAALLTRHVERVRKDGQAFSPAVYKHGATRGNAGVDYLTALVFDYDHLAPPVAALAPFEHVRYTTHSHAPTDQRWRLVLPTRRRLPVDEYREVWRRAVAALVPGADPACKDPARLHYLPACRPGAPRESYWNHGALLDPDALPAPPSGERRAPAGARLVVEGAGGRPGDDFNRCGDVRALLERHGWTLRSSRGGESYWLRPGKRGGTHSATLNFHDSGLFYCFTSSAPPFESGSAYSPFAVVALLEHGGDFAACTKALAAQGFGASLPAVRPSAAAVPPPPVVRPGGAAWR